MNDVFITAYSSISSLGICNSQTIDNLQTGKQPIHFPDAGEKFTKPSFPIKFDLNFKDKTRCSQIALALLSQVDEELSSENRIPIFMSTSTGGIRETEGNYASLFNRNSDYSIFKNHFFNAVYDDIHKQYKDKFISPFTISTACSSSGHSIMQAYNFIKNSIVDKAIILGVDSICYTTMIGFDSLRLVSEKGTKPLTLNRDGLSIGEGGGILFLESRPSRVPSAEIVSCGTNTDGYHISSPDPSGKLQRECIMGCIRDAEIEPEDIDYINAHGTGTILNDQTEIDVIKSIFTRPVTVTSLKGFIGHLLGASAITEVAIVLEMLKTGNIFQPEALGETIDNKYIPEKSIKKKVKYFLKNSFGFGGNNVSIIFKKS